MVLMAQNNVSVNREKTAKFQHWVRTDYEQR